MLCYIFTSILYFVEQTSLFDKLYGFQIPKKSKSGIRRPFLFVVQSAWFLNILFQGKF